MKKLLFGLVVLSSVGLLAACGNQAEETSEDKVITVAAQAPPMTEVIKKAAEVAKESDSPLQWRALHQALRARLRAAKHSQQPSWAEMIEASERTEKLIIDRNLNPQLQLTALFVDIYRIAASR